MRCSEFRPPAIPLVTHDPYTSCWSMSDCLYDDWPRHWTGSPHSMYGVIRVDGKPMRFMGKDCRCEDTVRQTGIKVRPTQTIYAFACTGVDLTVTFTSPLLLDDIDILARPVSYVAFDVVANDGRRHDVQIYLDISGEWAVNTPDQGVVWQRFKSERLNILSIRAAEQAILAKKGDNLRIDWGALFLAVAGNSAMTAIGAADTVRTGFIESGTLPRQDVAADKMPCPADTSPVLAVVVNVSEVQRRPRRAHVLIAYDDEYSIEYFGERLRPWWRRHPNVSAQQLLVCAEEEYETLTVRCRSFDDKLVADACKVGGEHYARLVALAYRQAISGHKLVAGKDGRPLFFSKENDSNGCIATVDVTYPSSPLFLLYNPALLEAMLEPIFHYCSGEHWPFACAAHDLGIYPIANGQAYKHKKGALCNMPVEECGNMLILTTAIAYLDGTTEFADRHWELLTKWADYLEKHGLDPGKQLCTDDFAGHLAHNANLSIKAIVALACYGRLAGMRND